jgi:hypothetical protein
MGFEGRGAVVEQGSDGAETGKKGRGSESKTTGGPDWSSIGADSEGKIRPIGIGIFDLRFIGIEMYVRRNSSR